MLQAALGPDVAAMRIAADDTLAALGDAAQTCQSVTPTRSQ
jgi:hypothetical protein